MKRLGVWRVAAALGVAFSGAAARAAAVVSVGAGGDYADIAAAVEAVDDGGAVELRAGTYALGATVEIAGKAVTIRGAFGTARDAVVVDGGGADSPKRCFAVRNSGTDKLVRFEGLTIRNARLERGNAMDGGVSDSDRFRGAAIWAKGNLQIVDCAIADCTVHCAHIAENAPDSAFPKIDAGGAVFVDCPAGAAALVRGVKFTGCRSEFICAGGTAVGRSDAASNSGAALYARGAAEGAVVVEGCEFAESMTLTDWSRIWSQFSRGTVGGAVCLRNALVADCIFRDNESARVDGTQLGTVVGALLLSGKCSVENSLFSGNRGGCGAGICVFKGAGDDVRIADCTFSGNAAQTGGGVFVWDKSRVEISGCRFEGNSGSGAALSLRGSECVVRDCLIAENDAGSKLSGGGIYVGSIPDIGSSIARSNVIERCVITANRCGGTGAAVMVEGGVRDLLVADCLITGNSAYTGNGVAAVAGFCDTTSGAAMSANRIRNCLIAGNSQDATLALPLIACRGKSAQSALGGFAAVVENCTIVDNVLGKGRYVVGDPNSKFPTGYDAVCLRNNIAARNSSSAGNVTLAQIGMQVEGAVYVANLTDEDGWTTDALRAANLVGDPLFRNAAAGDWRLRADSPARDRGAAVEGWPASSRDLGDGTWTARTAADDAAIPARGVRIEIANRNPRFGGAVDLGCFEYLARGTVILVR